MLHRMTGGRPTDPVRVLAAGCEAAGHGARGNQTSLVPLNRFADAVRPESELVRSMGLTEDTAFLRSQFTVWAANHARFQGLAKGNGFLEELLPLSKDLAWLGQVALRLLDAIEGREKLPADWVEQQRAEIARLALPRAEVVLAAYRPVKALLDQAAQTFAVR
jgi:hypothetical protein